MARDTTPDIKSGREARAQLASWSGRAAVATPTRQVVAVLGALGLACSAQADIDTHVLIGLQALHPCC